MLIASFFIKKLAHSLAESPSTVRNCSTVYLLGYPVVYEGQGEGAGLINTLTVGRELLLLMLSHLLRALC